MSRRNVFHTCLVVVWAGLAVSFAGAQTVWRVNDDAPGDPAPGDPSISDPLEDGSLEHPFDAIQEGIDAASDGDTVLVADGTYRHAGNKNLNYNGKAIAVRSENGPLNCVIDCDQDGRGFYFHNGETVDAIVDGFTITNSRTDDWINGAILAYHASFTITNCRITGNSGSGVFGVGDSFVVRHCTISDNVGAIDVDVTAGVTLGGGDATVEDCTITQNAMDAVGGIIFEGGNLTLTDCAITANEVIGGIGNGGGVGVFGEFATISNCTIAGNIGGYFGGGVHARGDLTIRDCTIAGNSASEWGGGLCLEGDGRMTLVNCPIINNSAEAGGGILQYGVNTTIVDCTIRGNSAQEGGGVCGWACASTVTNCEIICNLADGTTSSAGGGIVFLASELTLANCTLAKNTAIGNGGGAMLSDCDAMIANCAIVANTSGGKGGGVYYLRNSDVALVNSILFGNAAELGPQIGGGQLGTPAELSVSFSNIHGGEAEVYVEDGCTLSWGPGNLDTHPWFVDYSDGDYRLRPISPCIDAGCNCGVPRDEADLDDDGDTSEYLPFDRDGDGRFFDDPNTPDAGSGWPPIVDIGPYEFGGSDVSPCFGDVDGDRTITHGDLEVLLYNYGITSGADGTDGDLNCDGRISLTDLAALLSAYGNACD